MLSLLLGQAQAWKCISSSTHATGTPETFRTSETRTHKMGKASGWGKGLYVGCRILHVTFLPLDMRVPVTYELWPDIPSSLVWWWEHTGTMRSLMKVAQSENCNPEANCWWDGWEAVPVLLIFWVAWERYLANASPWMVVPLLRALEEAQTLHI